MGLEIRRLLRAAGLVLLVSFPPSAEGEPVRSFEGLSKSLKTGDVVAVTDWNGVETKGRLAAVTACSLVLVAAGNRVEIAAHSTKTVKLVRRAQRGAAINGKTADASGGCADVPCTAIRLAFAGTTAVARGFGKLFSRPKTVYRAGDQRLPSGVCQAATISTLHPRSAAIAAHG
jgi:hypothetical protein